MSVIEKCPTCDDPVERHSAFFSGCKWCACRWLPPGEALGLLFFDLMRWRRNLVESPGYAALSRDHRVPLETALDATIRDLKAQGVRPLYRESDMYDATELLHDHDEKEGI